MVSFRNPFKKRKVKPPAPGSIVPGSGRPGGQSGIPPEIPPGTTLTEAVDIGAGRTPISGGGAGGGRRPGQVGESEAQRQQRIAQQLAREQAERERLERERLERLRLAEIQRRKQQAEQERIRQARARQLEKQRQENIKRGRDEFQGFSGADVQQIKKPKKKSVAERVEENIRLGRSKFFGVSSAEVTGFQSKEAKELRDIAKEKKIDISTRAKELGFLGKVRRGEIGKPEEDEFVKRFREAEKQAQQKAEVVELPKADVTETPSSIISKSLEFGIIPSPIGFGFGRESVISFEETRPIREKVAEKVEDIIDFGEAVDIRNILVPQEFREFKRGFVKGAITEPIREPEKELLLIGAGLGLGKGLSLGSTALKSTGEIVGGIRGLKVASGVSKVGGGALALGVGGVVVVDVGGRVLVEPTLESKGRVLGETGAEFLGFGVGAKAGRELPLFLRQAKFIEGTELQLKSIKALEKSLVKQGVSDIDAKQLSTSLTKAVGLQRGFRKAPDPAIVKPIESVLPEGLTKQQKEIFKSIVFEPEAEIFGGQALQLRNIRETTDIDITLPRTETEVRAFGRIKARELEATGVDTIVGRGRGGVSLSIRGEPKGFDIKTSDVLEEFLLKEKPVKTKEGVKVSKLSEQFGRAISGTTELRKGGKDIKDVILSGRKFVEQQAILTERGAGFLRGLRRRGARKTELKLVEVEKAVPIIQDIASRISPKDIPKVPKRLGLITEDIDPLNLFPSGKKAQAPLSSIRDVRNIERDILGKKVFEPVELPRGSDLIPSLIQTSAIPKPSRIKPSSRLLSFSRFTPSRQPKPSKIPKPKTPKPSIIKLPPIPKIPLIPPTSIITPSKIRPPIVPPFKPPKIPEIPDEPIEKNGKKKKKTLFFFSGGRRIDPFKIKRKGKAFDDITFVEGFTAKALGFAPRRIKLSEIRKGRRETGLGFRGAPIIIQDIDRFGNVKRTSNKKRKQSLGLPTRKKGRKKKSRR